MTAAQHRRGVTPRLFACVDFVAVVRPREAMFPCLTTLLDPLSNPPANSLVLVLRLMCSSEGNFMRTRIARQVSLWVELNPLATLRLCKSIPSNLACQTASRFLLLMCMTQLA